MNSLMALSLVAIMHASLAANVVTPIYESPPKFYVENDEAKGLCIDVLKAIERVASDLHFVVVKNVPLKRIEIGTRRGTYDLLLCATPTPERNAQLRMIDIPVYSVRDVLIVRKDDPIVDATLDDIRKLGADNTILAYSGSGQNTWLGEQPNLHTDLGAPDPIANFQKLMFGRGRFVFAGEAVSVNVMRLPQFAEKFRILPTPVRVMGRYFFFSPNTPPQIVEKVRDALRQLAASGALKRIDSKYQLR
ncbi:ABC transporter substrate-binding protein [Rhodoferax sp. GW822-FHT02A01]|uniref:substrate-binding periplasmic protein n=1 Tax=Rhodoferax sp. GW822-FHT02A01 TaxID=3141537 RepID=UPI00315D8F9F